MRQIFMVAVLASQLAFAATPTLTLEQKLYDYLRSTQILEHSDVRFVGLWPNTVQAVGDSRVFSETDIFTGLHTMLMLDEIDKKQALVGYKQVQQTFQEAFEAYRSDSAQSAGTLNFWPLRAGSFHHFSTDPQIISVTGIPDLPNDFDDSALGFLWQMAQGQAPAEELLPVLGQYHDQRSGAFFTWFIPRESNTDCVVNLNILHALAQFESLGGHLPVETAAAKKSALRYIRQVIESKKTTTCASFYDRSSQFFVALARVYDAKNDSIDFVPLSTEALLSHAKLALSSKNGTELAEYIIALKLFSKAERSPTFASLIADLTQNLQSTIHQTTDLAFLDSDSVFLGESQQGEWAGKKQQWFSPAQSTATALLALTLP